jgi:GLPGLI family protein
MRTVFLLLLLGIAPLLMTNAQSTTGWARYEVSRHGETTRQELFFDQNSSYYIKFRSQMPDSILVLSKKRGRNNPDQDYLVKTVQGQRMSSQEYLKNGQRVVVHDSIPNIKWTLHSDTKLVGRFNCQKATCTFRCAEYTAWFSGEIPVSNGPWKLGGLPGLILELTNETINEVYRLSELDYPTRKVRPAPNFSKKEKEYNSYREFAEDQRKEVQKLVVYLKSQSNFPAGGEVHFEERECF